jgi:hypothetical protein
LPAARMTPLNFDIFVVDPSTELPRVLNFADAWSRAMMSKTTEVLAIVRHLP